MKLPWFCLAVFFGSAALPALAQSPVPTPAVALPPLQGARALVERLHQAKTVAESAAYLTNHSAAQESITYFSSLGLSLSLGSSPKAALHEIPALLRRYSLTEAQMNAAANFGLMPPPLAAHGRQFLQEYLRLTQTSSQEPPSTKGRSSKGKPRASLFPPAADFAFQVISPARVRIHLLFLRHTDAKGSRIIPNKGSDFDSEARLEDGQWYYELLPQTDTPAPAPPKSPAAARAAAFLLAIEEQNVAEVEKNLKEDPRLARRPLAFVPGSARSNYNLPLSLAVFVENQQIAALLIRAGASVNAADQDGNTPLEEAVQSSDSKMVALLLAHGANANHRNQDGQTALHEAALGGNSGIVALLITHGAHVNARDNDGETPLSLALSLPPELSNRATTALLRRHGAKVLPPE